LLRSGNQVKVLWVDTGIVVIPLFKIDVPSSKCVRFGAELSGMETDHKVNETREVFGK